MNAVDNTISGGEFGTAIQARYATVTQHFHGAVTPPRVPRMRPPAPEGFVDRDPVCAALDELSGRRAVRTSVQVVAITGLPGVGKSGVLAHWAAADGREEDFPGGTFYADLSPRGRLSPSDPASVLRTFVGALGTPRSEMPADEDALAVHFRWLTSDRPCLVLLDGVVNPAQVPHLLPGHPAGMVVLTSRQRLSGLRSLDMPRPDYLPLDALDDDNCARLLLGSAGREETVDGAELRTVVRALAGLPLAARIAGALADDPLGGGLTELARQLTDPPSLVKELAVPDGEAVGPAFAMAYEALDADGARTFRALGVHPTTETADELVEALAGGGADGRRVRRALLEAHLLEPAGRGRCRMNGLIHAYARELARREPDARAATEDFLADWYLRRAAAAELLLSPRWHHGAVFARPELLSGVFDSREQALDAMERDRENVAVVIERACAAGRYDTVCQLVEALHGFFFRHKHHALWIEACESAVEAAGHLQGTLAPARMHYELAFALIDRGSPQDLAEAESHYGRSLALAREAAHARTESSALEGLGQVAARQGRPLEALDRFREALRALGDTDHPRGRVLLEYHQGQAAGAAGQHEEAARLLLSAARRFAALPVPDRHNEAKSLLRYGRARLAADRPDEALPRLEEALGILAGLDAPKDEADAYLARGDAHAADGRAERARADWESALGLYRRLGSIEVGQAARRLAGPAQGQE